MANDNAGNNELPEVENAAQEPEFDCIKKVHNGRYSNRYVARRL
jgi:hypothetical protein